MKAKVIKTGEIVDVYHEPQHGQITNIYKESVLVNGRMWSEDELDFCVKSNEGTAMNTSITREQFTSAFEKVFSDNRDSLFDEIIEGFTTTNYRCFYHEETVYIVDLYNEELITWYKLGHIGRALKITKDDATIEYVEDMFKEFKDELNI